MLIAAISIVPLSIVYPLLDNPHGALSPLFGALFTDDVSGAEDSLRYSMATAAAITAPLSVLITWYGLKSYARSVVRSRAWT